MKRLSSTLLLYLAVFTMQAQTSLVLTAGRNAYRAGDEIVKQQVVYRNPGSRGKDLIGDFRRLQAVNEEYSLRRYTRLAPTRSEGSDEPQTEGRHEIPVDMSACPTGTYTLYVYVDDVVMSLNVVKK